MNSADYELNYILIIFMLARKSYMYICYTVHALYGPKTRPGKNYFIICVRSANALWCVAQIASSLSCVMGGRGGRGDMHDVCVCAFGRDTCQR